MFLNGPTNSQKSTSIPPRGGNSRTPIGFSSMKDRILLEFEGICHVNPAFCFGVQLSFSYCWPLFVTFCQCSRRYVTICDLHSVFLSRRLSLHLIKLDTSPFSNMNRLDFFRLWAYTTREKCDYFTVIWHCFLPQSLPWWSYQPLRYLANPEISDSPCWS